MEEATWLETALLAEDLDYLTMTQSTQVNQVKNGQKGLDLYSGIAKLPEGAVI